MTHASRSSIVAIATILAAACNRSPAPTPGSGESAGGGNAGIATAPSGGEARPATELPADVSAVMDQLQTKLKERLLAEIAKGGPAAAAEVCRTEAAAMTASLQRQGLAIGRTSHALRNPANQPPGWAAAWVQAQSGRKVAAGAKLAEADLPGGGKGYLRVIGTAPLCLTCHGPAESLDPSLKTVLARAYPQDRATGFAENDVRGWFWAERVR